MELGFRPGALRHGGLIPRLYYSIIEIVALLAECNLMILNAFSLSERRSGTEKAANGEAVLPIVVVGRIDGTGAVEVEVVGVAGASTRGR